LARLAYSLLRVSAHSAFSEAFTDSRVRVAPTASSIVATPIILALRGLFLRPDSAVATDDDGPGREDPEADIEEAHELEHPLAQAMSCPRLTKARVPVPGPQHQCPQ
jgi:hypothetical protein